MHHNNQNQNNSNTEQQCLFKGCMEYLRNDNGKTGKYCKRHRQQIYKRKYLKKSHKLRTKYQESKTCFSGSPDLFDGQDIDSILHQVLANKRMEMLRSPEIVGFLKTKQQQVKNKSRESIKKPSIDMKKEALFLNREMTPVYLDSATAQLLDHNSNIQILDSGAMIQWKEKTIDPGKLDRGLTPSVLTPSVLMPEDRKLKNDLQSFQKQIISNHNNVLKPEASSSSLLGDDVGEILTINYQNGIFSNSLNLQPGNLPCIGNSQEERRSAFKETGAGDAKSLLAVRTVQPNES